MKFKLIVTIRDKRDGHWLTSEEEFSDLKDVRRRLKEFEGKWEKENISLRQLTLTALD